MERIALCHCRLLGRFLRVLVGSGILHEEDGGERVVHRIAYLSHSRGARGDGACLRSMDAKADVSSRLARHGASAWLSQTGHSLLSRAFSRGDELEADVFAEALVRTAGGDPLAGESLLGNLASGSADQRVCIAWAYFATHPSLIDRVANLRAKRRIGPTRR